MADHPVDSSSVPAEPAASDWAEAEATAQEREETTRQAVQVLMSASFSGPLPPPSLLAGYEAAVPGAGERVLKLAEDEARHRRSRDLRDDQHEHLQVVLGQLLAMAAVIVVIAGGAAVAIWNPSPAGVTGGSLISIVGLSSLIAVFITRRRAEEKERHRTSSTGESP